MIVLSAGQTFLFVWLIAANAYGLYLIVHDKENAIKREWRVKESRLFLVALLFGAFGIWLGMYGMRHKTKKFFFYAGIPMLVWENILVSAILLIYVL